MAHIQATRAVEDAREIQEEARQKFSTGKLNILDYLSIVFRNPLIFPRTRHARVVVKRNNGNLRIRVIKSSRIDDGD